MTAVGPAVTIIAGDNLIPTEMGKAGGWKLTATLIDSSRYEGTITTEVRRGGMVLRAGDIVIGVLKTIVLADVLAGRI